MALQAFGTWRCWRCMTVVLALQPQHEWSRKCHASHATFRRGPAPCQGDALLAGYVFADEVSPAIRRGCLAGHRKPPHDGIGVLLVIALLRPKAWGLGCSATETAVSKPRHPGISTPTALCTYSDHTAPPRCVHGHTVALAQRSDRHVSFTCPRYRQAHFPAAPAGIGQPPGC